MKKSEKVEYAKMVEAKRDDTCADEIIEVLTNSFDTNRDDIFEDDAYSSFADIDEIEISVDGAKRPLNVVIKILLLVTGISYSPNTIVLFVELSLYALISNGPLLIELIPEELIWL